MLKYYLFALPQLFLFFKTFSQTSPYDIKPLTFASPNVASLGKYGEIPVGYYTGVPDINVPLHEIVEGEIKLPITLNYHASGIKVEEVSSNIGIGWSLNVGGMISAEIRGMEDYSPLTDITGLAERGTLSAMYSQVSWAPRILSGGDLTNQDDIQMFNEIKDNQKDGEADIYSLNAGNINCKFFMNNAGNFMMMPYQNIVIAHDPLTKKWVITDSNGTKYRFGNHSETSTDDSGTIYSTHTTAWHVDEIEDAYGNKITFHYTSFLSHSYNMNQTRGAVLEAVGDFQIERFVDGVQRNHALLHEQRLDSITTSSGTKVQFYSSKTRLDHEYEFTLDSIVFFNSNKEIFKKASLHHSYFTGIDSPRFPFENDVFSNSNSTKRLRFDSILINDQNYRFIYDNTPLPTRFSIDQDLWGYYNAAGNSIFVPYYFEAVSPSKYVTFEGGNRTSNPQVMQSGILKKIVYPTDGFTLFEYEPNLIRDKLLNGIPASITLKDTTTVTTFSGLSSCTSPSYSAIFNYRLGSMPPHFEIVVINEALNWRDNLYIELVDAATSGSVYHQQISNLGEDIPSSLAPPPGKYKLRVCGSQGTFLIYVRWKTPNEDLSHGDQIVNKIIGGLRIKSIANYSSDQEMAELISYKYSIESDPSISSGGIVNYPMHYRDYFTVTNKNGGTPSGPCVMELGVGSAHYKIYTSYSNMPLALNNNSYVGYNTVTEERGINGIGGKTVYIFSDVSSDPDVKVDPDWDWPQTPYTSLSWNRGLMLQKKIFKSENGQSILVKNVTNYFSKKSTWLDASRRCVNIKAIPYYHVKWILNAGCGDIPTYNNIAWRPYLTISGWNTLDSTVARTYNGASFIEEITRYKYSDVYLKNHLSIIEQSNTNSNGDIVRETYKYPFDYTNLTGSSDDVLGIKNLQNLHITDKTVEQSSYIKKKLGTEYLTHSSYIEYVPDKGLSKNIFESESTGLIADFIPSYSTAGSILKDDRYYKLKGTFSAYTSNGKILELSKTQDKKYSYLWGYNNQVVIAQAENAGQSQIFHSGFEVDGVIGAAHTGKKYLNTGTYSIPFTPPSDGAVYKMSYWYWSGNQWNFSGELPFNSSINAGSRLDDIRVYPKGAIMTTYTYNPGIGMTSATDSNNISIFYEYDFANRLKAIRDDKGNILKTYNYNFQSN